jgi:hypothetical protein
MIGPDFPKEYKMKTIIIGLLATASIGVTGASAQQSKVPPVEQAKLMLNSAKSGWVAFRNYNGKQLIYFSNILSYHCNIKSLNYWINDETEANSWAIPKCNPHNPYAVDPTKDPIYFSRPLGSIKKLTVLVTFIDETQTQDVTFTPCDNVGEQACALVAE